MHERSRKGRRLPTFPRPLALSPHPKKVLEESDVDRLEVAVRPDNKGSEGGGNG